MPPRIDWDSQLGRRMRLRDLHVFATTVRLGSMAKAAKELGVSQPAVSEVIAELEHTLGVQLLDRVPRGVEPTVYGSALLRRSVAGVYRAVRIQATGAEEAPVTGAVAGRYSFPTKSQTAQALNAA